MRVCGCEVNAGPEQGRVAVRSGWAPPSRRWTAGARPRVPCPVYSGSPEDAARLPIRVDPVFPMWSGRAFIVVVTEDRLW